MDNQNQPVVSVIMPVYRVEDYLRSAIHSLQRQTLSDWELWAVDDGSPDQSGQILDQMAAEDSRIHVVHQANAGAHNARNAVIPKTVGRYLYFMDADDWAEPTMLQDMVALADQHNAQLVVTGYYIDTYYDDTNAYVQLQSQPDAVYPTAEEFHQNAYKLFDANLLYTPWNKLYSAEYIKQNGILFPQTFWDDFPFNLAVVRDVQRVCVSAQPYYHFIRKRAESETAKYRAEMYQKREEEHSWMLDLYAHWQVNDPDSREFLARRYVERVVGCIENLQNPGCTLSRREKRAQAAAMIRNDRIRTELKLARPRSTAMKVLLLPIRMGNVTLTLLEGAVVSAVKRRNVKLFARLKANR